MVCSSSFLEYWEHLYTAGEIQVMARKAGFQVLNVKQQWVLEGKPGSVEQISAYTGYPLKEIRRG